MLDLMLFYGSYRRDRMGIRLADYLVRRLGERGHRIEFVDAQAVGLPMLDRMYKEYPEGEAPAAMQRLAERIRAADGFLFVAGEYNWGMQPGLKNLTDHFLEEWFWRPGAIASYSPGRVGGARANLLWHGTLSEMGMAVVPSTLTVGQIGMALDAGGQPTGDGGAALEQAFPRFAADLEWWAEAVRAQKAVRRPPY
jgi:NAD(P)H-dependent FMN reductase